MPCDSVSAAPSQRFLHSAAFPQRPGLADPPTLPPPNLRRDLPWGKNPARRGARGIPGHNKNFNCPGGGCKEPRRRGPGPPCAQASADFRRDQLRRSGLLLLISAAVLREWQLWHRLWRLPKSVNKAQSPLWSRMWSTSVALVRMPCWAHSRHHGSRRSCSLRSVFQSCVLYIQRQACASWLRSLGFGWCSAQYPPGTSR